MSVFETGWFKLSQEWNNEEIKHRVELVIKLRDEINKIVEKLRNAKLIKVNDELDVTISRELDLNVQELTQAWSVAKVSVKEDMKVEKEIEGINVEGECEGVSFVLSKSKKHKCPRCWRYDSNQELELCTRCVPLVL